MCNISNSWSLTADYVHINILCFVFCHPHVCGDPDFEVILSVKLKINISKGFALKLYADVLVKLYCRDNRCLTEGV